MRALASITATLVLVCEITGCNLPGSVRKEVAGHKASFLFDNAATRVMNILSPACDDGTFEHILNRCVRNGDDVVYLYTAFEHDGPWGPFSPYHGNQIGGELNQGVVDHMARRIKRCRDRGLAVVLWLRADDSPTFNRTPPDRQMRYQADMVKAFDKLTLAWVVGLELDEYMRADACENYAAHLQGITDRHVGTHQVPRQWSYATLPSVDGCWYQTGFNRTPQAIQGDVAAVCAALGGKPLIAAEYHKSSSTPQAKALGDAAMDGGAIATGNGRN